MRVFVLAITIGAAWRLAPAQQSNLPRVEQIDGDRVHTLLRPDAIPAIDQPQLGRASQATFMRDDEPVIGVVARGVARAYSTWHLDHPGTLVLAKPPLSGSPYDDYLADPTRIGVRGSINPDPRLTGKELVIGVERNGRFAAIPLAIVQKLEAS